MLNTLPGQLGLLAGLRSAFARRKVRGTSESTAALSTRTKVVEAEELREAQPRAFANWNPGTYRAAVQLADGGSLRLAADLCEELMADDRVQGVLGVRVRGLLRFDLSFEVGEEDELEDEKAALEEDFWRMYPEAELVKLCSWGLLLGVGVGQQVWREHEGRLIPRLKVWHPRALRWDWHTREWKLAVDGGSEIVIEPGDGTWVLYTPYGEGRPWAAALWKPAGFAWLAKRFAIEDYNRHAEAHGSPVRVGYVQDGAAAETRRVFAEDLQALASDSSVVLPPGYDLKFVEATARTWEVFTSLIGWADRAIAICIAGQNLSSEVDGGSFAAAKVHQAIASHLIQSDEQTLSSTLHEQGLSWWAEFNFGDARRAPWVRWDTTPPDDLQAKATAISTLAGALEGLERAGFLLDKTELARRFEIPLLDLGEKEVDELARAAKLLNSLPAYLPTGVVTVNEARGLLGMPPIAGGDEPIRPMGQQGFLKALKAIQHTGTAALRGGADSALSDGEAFIEELVEEAEEAGAELLKRDSDRLREVVEASNSQEDMERRLNELFAELDPSELVELITKATILAELAGRFEVIEEVVG